VKENESILSDAANRSHIAVETRKFVQGYPRLANQGCPPQHLQDRAGLHIIAVAPVALGECSNGGEWVAGGTESKGDRSEEV
jgi:hypothetical protein